MQKRYTFLACSVVSVTVLLGVFSAIVTAGAHKHANRSAAASAVSTDIAVSTETAIPVEPSPELASLETKSVATGQSSDLQTMAYSAPKGVYKTVKPCRIYDTRSNTANATKVDSSTVNLRIAGKCGLPASLLAVQVGVTSSSKGSGNFATLWNTGTPIPNVSTINIAPGETRSNSAIVGASSGSVSVYNQSDSVTIVDVYGYWIETSTRASTGRYVPLTPTRFFDSRQTGGKLKADTPLTLTMPSYIPSDAIAVVANITAVESTATSLGFVTVWSGNGPMTDTSAITLDKNGQTRAAGGIYGLTNKTLNIQPNLGAMHIIVDISGYITGSSAPSSLSSRLAIAEPVRLLDSRSGNKIIGGVAGGTTIENANSGDASGFVYNLTFLQPNSSGFLSLTVGEGEEPTTSSVNAAKPGEIVANFAVTPAGSKGTTIYNSVTTHILLDYVGYFTGDHLDSLDEKKEIQTRLNELGCAAGVVDGIFGSQTSAAIRRFQVANPPLATDGVIGLTTSSQTYKALMGDYPNYCVLPPAKPGIAGLSIKASMSSLPAPIWPSENKILTACWGDMRSYTEVSEKGHSGIDIGADVGQNVFSPWAGLVVASSTGYNVGIGNYVRVAHFRLTDGTIVYTEYHHLKSATLPPVGTVVAAGNVVAKSGDTGYVDGPHLHFNLVKGAPTDVGPAKRGVETLNPMLYGFSMPGLSGAQGACTQYPNGGGSSNL
jgi:murein DD-endopeptidase MepM/ murein hydrolase activator NlpD